MWLECEISGRGFVERGAGSHKLKQYNHTFVSMGKKIRETAHNGVY